MELPATVVMELPAAVVMEHPAAVAIELPAAVAIELPAAVVMELPAAVAMEHPEAVAIELPAAVAMEHPEAVAIELPAAVAVHQHEALRDGRLVVLDFSGIELLLIGINQRPVNNIIIAAPKKIVPDYLHKVVKCLGIVGSHVLRSAGASLMRPAEYLFLQFVESFHNPLSFIIVINLITVIVECPPYPEQPLRREPDRSILHLRHAAPEDAGDIEGRGMGGMHAGIPEAPAHSLHGREQGFRTAGLHRHFRP